jgi:cell division septation protein DedD
MAAAAGLILSFLAGVAVGRGVDASAGDARGTKAVAEEHIVPEEPPTTQAAPAAGDLSYAQRLESEKPDHGLEEPPAQAKGGSQADKPKATPAGKETPTESKKVAKASPEPKKAASAAPPKASPKPAQSAKAEAQEKPAASAAASFTIQVGAFRDKGTADAMVARLKGKGFPAYVATPDAVDSSLFHVRVGSYPSRPDAEKVETRLRDEEKFKPVIVKN